MDVLRLPLSSVIHSILFFFLQVKQIFNKSVSWIRVRDDHILTVDRTTFIADERFHAYYSLNEGQQPDAWTLQIKYVQARDAGLYECHLNLYGDEKKVSARVLLHVVGKW